MEKFSQFQLALEQIVYVQSLKALQESSHRYQPDPALRLTY